MNAFAKYCATHNVDTQDFAALDRAWARFERTKKIAPRRDPELEAYAEQSQTASAWIESEGSKGQ